MARPAWVKSRVLNAHNIPPPRPPSSPNPSRASPSNVTPLCEANSLRDVSGRVPPSPPAAARVALHESA